MTTREYMANEAVRIANDNSYGYTNDYPDNQWWNGTDMDCGSFISYCLHLALEQVGVETGHEYFEPQSGSTIYNEAFLLKYCDKKSYSKSTLAVGDILMKNGHVVMVTQVSPSVLLTHASQDTDGKTGDSNGNEILTVSFYDGGWTYIYRIKDEYNGETCTESEDYDVSKLPTLKYGSSGDTVKCLQALLNLFMSKSTALLTDGDFGSLTEQRLIEYQTVRNTQGASLVVDGVCGAQTWADILVG